MAAAARNLSEQRARDARKRRAVQTIPVHELDMAATAAPCFLTDPRHQLRPQREREEFRRLAVLPYRVDAGRNDLRHARHDRVLAMDPVSPLAEDHGLPEIDADQWAGERWRIPRSRVMTSMFYGNALPMQ